MRARAKPNRFGVLAVLAAALAASLLVFVLSTRVSDAQTSSTSTYTVEDLGTLGIYTNSTSVATDVNNSGQVVGGSDNRAFLYENGQMKDIGRLSDQGNTQAEAINDNGKVVGTSTAVDPERGPVPRAFLYDSKQPNSQMQDLGYTPGTYPNSNAFGINNSDQIVGGTSAGAAIYQDGQWSVLAAPPGFSPELVKDINDSGLYIGRGEIFSSKWGREVQQPFVGTTAIDTFDNSCCRGDALHINDNGDTVGYFSNTDTGSLHAFLYKDGQIQDLGLPPDRAASVAYDINNIGQIVGYGVSGGDGAKAFLYEKGQWKPLNAMIPADSGWNLVSAVAINDEGQIVGLGYNPEGKERAFLLTPGSSTPPDTTNPTLNLPGGTSGGITEEATGTNGAAVNYTATATDDTDGDVSVTCEPPSGSTFSTGTTTVNCSATDAAGNEATGSFTVTVEDTTAPTISGVPSDITRTTTNSSGTSVTYSVPTANDAVDGSVNVSCDPASGSTFAIGETTVTCSAKDSRANLSSKTFKVKVTYDFGNGSGGGFAQPVSGSVLNEMKAGAGVPVKFGLGGNLGLDIFAAGYPTSKRITCDTHAPIDPIEETVAISNSGLKYDATTSQYVYNWKTDKTWAGTCRQLVIKLKDGTEHPVNFKFK